jgi:hypothetical protein
LCPTEEKATLFSPAEEFSEMKTADGVVHHYKEN